MKGVRLSKKSAERVSAVVRKVEHEIGGGTPDSRGRWGGGWGPPKLLAKTGVGGVTACTGTGPYTYGSGSGTVIEVNSTGTTGTLTSRTITLLNMAEVAVAASKQVQCCWIEGHWFVDVESCPAP